MGYVSAIRNNAIAVLGLTVWLIAGCAATDYQSSISKFADAAMKSDDSVETMFATRREARVAMQVKEVGEGKLVPRRLAWVATSPLWQPQVEFPGNQIHDRDQVAG